jgi:cell fate regulator YaaT (PSP1 superfamily)
MKQVGVRDEAKAIGGFGICGETLCCSSWLPDFTPVTIKMAKTQGLALNPSKISGVCGRLMCCLQYEHDNYKEMAKNLPRTNSNVDTPDGPGKVLKNEILEQKVVVRLNDESIMTYHHKELINNPAQPKTPNS